jgi:hypothetical protein
MSATIYVCINMSKSRRSKLKSASKKLNVKEQDLLGVLFFKGAEVLAKEPGCFKAVHYQPKGEEYKPTSLKVNITERELMLANRFVYRYSMSFILRRGIDLFLDLILARGLTQIEILYNRMKRIEKQKEVIVIKNMEFGGFTSRRYHEYTLKVRGRDYSGYLKNAKPPE